MFQKSKQVGRDELSSVPDGVPFCVDNHRARLRWVQRQNAGAKDSGGVELFPRDRGTGEE